MTPRMTSTIWAGRLFQILMMSEKKDLWYIKVLANGILYLYLGSCMCFSTCEYNANLPVKFEGWHFTHMRKTSAWPHHFTREQVWAYETSLQLKCLYQDRKVMSYLCYWVDFTLISTIFPLEFGTTMWYFCRFHFICIVLLFIYKIKLLCDKNNCMSACAERALRQLHHCEKRHIAVAVGFNIDRLKCC